MTGAGGVGGGDVALLRPVRGGEADEVLPGRPDAQDARPDGRLDLLIGTVPSPNGLVVAPDRLAGQHLREEDRHVEGGVEDHHQIPRSASCARSSALRLVACKPS